MVGFVVAGSSEPDQDYWGIEEKVKDAKSFYCGL